MHPQVASPWTAQVFQWLRRASYRQLDGAPAFLFQGRGRCLVRRSSHFVIGRWPFSGVYLCTSWSGACAARRELGRIGSLWHLRSLTGCARQSRERGTQGGGHPKVAGSQGTAPSHQHHDQSGDEEERQENVGDSLVTAQRFK